MVFWAIAAHYTRDTPVAVCEVEDIEVKYSHPWAYGKETFMGNPSRKSQCRFQEARVFAHCVYHFCKHQTPNCPSRVMLASYRSTGRAMVNVSVPEETHN